MPRHLRDRLLAHAETTYGIPPSAVLGSTRETLTLHIRWATLHLIAQRHSHLTDFHLARLIGRDRTSIAYIRRGITDLLDTRDPHFARILRTLETAAGTTPVATLHRRLRLAIHTALADPSTQLSPAHRQRISAALIA